MKSLSVIILLLFLSNYLSAQSYSFDSILIIKGKPYLVSTRDINKDFVLLTTTSGSLSALRDTIPIEDTIGSTEFSNLEFRDLNNDGYRDIMLTYRGNNATYFLYLFDPPTNKFKKIEGFEKYPAAVQLKSNPKLYYSYHRAGCADWNWVSDLFTIKNYKAIQLGHIYGQGCDADVKEEPQEIRIYKVPNNNEDKEKLVEKWPYSKAVESFGDKWDFIEGYWNKNYGKFE